jgi:hypothetical protein
MAMCQASMAIGQARLMICTVLLTNQLWLIIRTFLLHGVVGVDLRPDSRLQQVLI